MVLHGLFFSWVEDADVSGNDGQPFPVSEQMVKLGYLRLVMATLKMPHYVLILVSDIDHFQKGSITKSVRFSCMCVFWRDRITSGVV